VLFATTPVPEFVASHPLDLCLSSGEKKGTTFPGQKYVIDLSENGS
jgi:hypothetical protein